MSFFERNKHRLPKFLVSVLLVFTLYSFLWSWSKAASIVATQYFTKQITYLSGVFGSSQVPSLVSVFTVGVISTFTWLLSTRVTFYQKRKIRLAMFLLMLLSIWGVFAAYGMGQARERFIPYFTERLSNVIETNGFFESIVFEHTHGFYLMLTMLPLFLMFLISLFVLTKFLRHDKELIEPFFEFQWRHPMLQKFSRLEETEYFPDIELGPHVETKEMVIMPGKDRTLNTMIIGSIGTGKTAALGLPMINQDLHHMTRFINSFPHIYQQEDYETEDVRGKHLNGISVIDPSNDLCQKTLALVKAHGVPDEAITYINPLDPNTPSINPMRGPVDKVAEVFAQIIAGLNDSKDGGNFFFEQAQRNHLKHYIYLLKLHDTEKEVTFDMLLDMYNNPQLVRQMHEQLKKTFPKGYEDFTDRDERNYWKIVQGIDEWFDLNLLPKTVRVGQMVKEERDDDGNILYYDAKEEHVQGLRNILNDIGANPLIRRVLFGTSDFDFDRHMEIGGVLLVNTAKGELVNLARVLGKIVLMNLQNASFRRQPNTSTFHHILVDEAPDYLYNAFREFPAQSRKYKVIVTTLQQTIAQLADHFGEHYMTTLIGTMRNRMVYGDVPAYDAKYFSEMFGEKYTYQEGQTEMAVSPLQEDPMSRSGSSYSKVREQALTGADIMYQDAFQCAVKIVVHNKPMPVAQIAANFVPAEEFEEALVLVDDEAADIWLAQRRLYGVDQSETAHDIQSIEETEIQNEQIYVAESHNAIALDEEMIDQALKVTVEPKPRDVVVYNDEASISSKEECEQSAVDASNEPDEIDLYTLTKEKPPLGPPVPTTLQGIVTDWETDTVLASIPDHATEMEGEHAQQTDTVVAVVQSETEEQHISSIQDEYKTSELNKEQEDFFNKFGIGIEEYK